MKRRNADSTKFRKQFHFRKCKFAEGVYGSSTFLYLKFLFIWLLIMIADFLLEFRFEFLWPFWLVIRSLHDSFKYQGIIFSIFFALITFFSDLLCYMFLPVQWLFFAASTYVWVQYVWHTEKGVCLPTISLWLLFVYIEASLRLKTLKTIDLCRPFAAHCIGYPMVTLGFGFKSYLSYKLRLKKQKEIQKINEFYMQLIAKALPLELQLKDKEKFKALNYEEEISSQQVLSVTSSSQSSSILASICNIGSNNNNNNSNNNNNNNNINNNNNNTSQQTSPASAAFIKDNKNSKSNNGILATALSFYLNGNNSHANNSNSQSTNNSSQQQISNTQIEDLPYIQQKDMANVINKNNYTSKDLMNLNNNKSNDFNFKNSAQQQQQSFNKSNSFSTSYNNSNFSKQKNQLNDSNSNDNQSVNCNLSSFSIASLAYSTSTDQSNNNNSSTGNLPVLFNQKLDSGASNGNESNTSSSHRSASSSATGSSSSTFLPNNSNNHTNININMTINTTAIATATATATATNPSTNQASVNTILSKAAPNGNTSNNSSNGKKYKNKESTQRANSVTSSSSSSTLNSQQQLSNTNGSSASGNSDDNLFSYKDEMINKLEEDLKKLRLEIQQQKSVEQYLRNQINYITKCDRTEKLKLERLQQENKTLQTKLNKLITQSQKDKDEIDSLEKRLQEEKQAKTTIETQLSLEKKLRDDQQQQLKPKNQSQLINAECSTEFCKNRLKEFENENKKLNEECRFKQERIMMLECEIKSLAKYRENENRVDTLMVALNLMEDKNTSLQESLSAETRFKLDLFSALGETRRQLEAVNFQLKSKERELNTFKAILKQSLTNGSSGGSSNGSDTLNLNLTDVISQLNSANLLSNNNLSSGTSNEYSMNGFISNQQQQPPQQQQQQNSQSSNLNGNLLYLPKI